MILKKAESLFMKGVVEGSYSVTGDQLQTQ
jgi:hypothetical protein